MTGSCQLGNFPQCTFSYQGPILPGADVITGCLDVNNDGSVATDEPCATATVAWLMPALPTPGQVTGGGQVPSPSGTDQSAFGFSARMATNGSLDGQCTVVDPATKTTIRCLDVYFLAVEGNHALIMGFATVNGVVTRYRIDANDLAEPGRDKDTFTIRTEDGYTVGGVLTQGNVQIRK
jgi:hypothetical protein